MADFVNAAMSGFQSGAAMGGGSAIGEFVKGLTERAKEFQAQQWKVQQIGAEAQAKSAYDPEARAKQEAYQYVNQATVPPTPEGGYNPQEMEAGIPGQVQEAAQGRRMQMFQQSGLLPRPQKSLEEVFAESEARSRGATAGRPPPGAAKAATIVQQARGSLAQLKTVFAEAAKNLPAIVDDPKDLIPEGVGAIAGGIGRKFLASTGFNEPARGFLETQVANARQVIRGLGEVGVLTDKDVADAVRLLPSSTDSGTVRQQKLNALTDLIESKIRSYESTQGAVGNEFSADDDFIQQLQAQGFTLEALP